MRMQEESMPVPDKEPWVKLPDSECYQYIREAITVKQY
jgi:hypothetical protein